MQIKMSFFYAVIGVLAATFQQFGKASDILVGVN